MACNKISLRGKITTDYDFFITVLKGYLSLVMGFTIRYMISLPQFAKSNSLMAHIFIEAATLAPHKQLQQFKNYRWGLIIAEVLVAVLAWFFNYPILNPHLIISLLMLHGISNTVMYWIPQPQNYTAQVVALSCVMDILLLTLFLAFSGGANNGFVSVLLLPVATAAVLLSPVSAYLHSLLAIVCYSLLLLPQAMTPVLHHTHHYNAEYWSEHAFNTHLLQMWAAFSFSVLLVSWFVSNQAQLIRKQAKRLGLFQQQQVQQEQLLALSSYAANAAHQLATPIQNISLLASELQESQTAHPAITDLIHETARCQTIVHELRTNAQQLREQQFTPQPIINVIKQALDSWLVSRSEITLLQQHQHDNSVCTVNESRSFSAALLNILDNAADASSYTGQYKLDIESQITQGQLTLIIRDYGEGLSAQRLQELGKVPQPSEQGLGIGQFLANMTIERLGGVVTRRLHPAGGVETTIRYPATIN